MRGDDRFLGGHRVCRLRQLSRPRSQALGDPGREQLLRSSEWCRTPVFDPWVGRALTVVAGGALLVGCFLFARREDDARAFTCAVAATLAISPIVWFHYLVVLLVPMAILRPRFSAIWLLPVLLWVSPKPGYAEGLATFVPAIAVVIVLVALLARPAPGRVAAPATS